jgi:hypothetical protein
MLNKLPYTKIISKIFPHSNIINHERRDIGLQIANFEERKKIQKRKQIRKQEYEQRIETDVWLG